MIRAALLALALIAAAVPALAQGMLGFNEEPSGPADPAAPPPPAPDPAPAPAPGAIVFPGLVGCEGGLSGLPPGPAAATSALLDRRIRFLAALEYLTLDAFTHPAQAERAARCLTARLALVTGYAPHDAQRDAARMLAATVHARWGNRLDALRTGDAAAAATAQWWTEADAAFGDIVRLEAAIAAASAAPNPARDPLLKAATDAVAELNAVIASVRSFADTLDDAGRAYWLRAMTWRTRQAALALDTLQAFDISADPEGVQAHLTGAGAPATQDAALAGDMATFLADRSRIRAAAGELHPAAARDWSPAGRRQQALDELYLLNFMGTTIRRQINARLAEEATLFRERLDLAHTADMAAGMTAADSARLRQADWEAFVALQTDRRRAALERWRTELAGMRAARVALGPSLSLR